MTSPSTCLSIIMPMHNAAKTIDRAVASVKAQTVTDWEAWLIDDGSTDTTIAQARAAIGEDRRFRLIRLPHHQGAASARNAALRIAGGRYLSFLDADDLWYPNKLALQLRALQAGAVMVHSSYLRVGTNGAPLGVVKARALTRYSDALGANPIGCLTSTYDRLAFPQAQMPDLTLRQDYAHWLNLLKNGATAVGLPDVVAEYHIRPDSLSANKVKAAMATWRVFRQTEKLPLSHATLCMTNYARKAIARRISEVTGAAELLPAA